MRHAEIDDPEELLDVRLSLWSVEIEDIIPRPIYSACQKYARSLRDKGQIRIHEKSAALSPGGARGQRVNKGLNAGPAKEGIVIVIFDCLPTTSNRCINTGSPPVHVASITGHY